MITRKTHREMIQWLKQQEASQAQ